MKYDVIIIGAGPAGLTAAIYAARYRLNTLVIGKLVGGVVTEAFEVHNFPSYENINGFELMKKISKQVEALGVGIKQETVKEIKKSKDFIVKTNKTEYTAKKIIIAAGTARQKLGIPSEAKFFGKGISYCATCDSGFYKDKIVGVIGGSDAALTAAILLSRFATKVYILYRKDKFFRAEPAWIEEVKKNKKIEPIFNTNVIEFLGNKKLEKVKLDTKKELALEGIFIEIGSIPNTKLLEQLGVKFESREAITDKNQKTNVAGVFVAGDLTNNPLKQMITACAEGAIAAQSAYQELRKN